MLPLFFCEQGATTPVGHNGGITLTQSAANPAFWTATPWYGATNLGGITLPRKADALQRAIIVLISYTADLTDVDPDN
jgi:hypothetical protein